MGLIKCPDCGNMVSDRAAFCPSCGCPGDVIREEYDKENDPQRLTYIFLMFNLLKCADRKDLVLANDCFMNELKKRFDVGYPVAFIGRDNFSNTGSSPSRGATGLPISFTTIPRLSRAITLRI